jgi:hypothetical protein
MASMFEAPVSADAEGRNLIALQPVPWLDARANKLTLRARSNRRQTPAEIFREVWVIVAVTLQAPSERQHQENDKKDSSDSDSAIWAVRVVTTATAKEQNQDQDQQER